MDAVDDLQRELMKVLESFGTYTTEQKRSFSMCARFFTIKNDNNRKGNDSAQSE